MLINKNAKHLLVVDDDNRIRSLLQKYLVENGYFVSSVKDTKEAESVLEEIDCNLIILDIMMPAETGIEFLKRYKLKSNKTIPVIMLTAMGETEDRILGLEVGADDYLVKPFEPKELLLRITSILRRTTENSQIYYFGNFCYNKKNSSLTKNNQAVFLTNSESSLLNLLLINANNLINREDIAEQLNINERSVDVQIVRLRNKIEENPSRPIYLQTIRSKGYIFKII